MTDEERNQLFEENRGQVYYIVKTFFSEQKQLQDDLVQSGLIGLWKASQHFEETLETKFATFASKYVYYEIVKEINRNMKYLGKELSFCDIDNSENGEFNEIEKSIQQDIFEERETADHLYLNILNEKEHQIFSLVSQCKSENKSIDSVCKKMKKSRTIIYKQYSQIRQKLLKAKNELELEPPDTSWILYDKIKDLFTREEINIIRKVNSGKPYKEIAKSFGITLGSLNYKLDKIRKKLKEKVGEKEIYLG